jgi:hypothetical protein
VRRAARLAAASPESGCRVCGGPTVAVVDGLALCDRCLRRPKSESTGQSGYYQTDSLWVVRRPPSGLRLPPAPARSRGRSAGSSPVANKAIPRTYAPNCRNSVSERPKTLDRGGTLRPPAQRSHAPAPRTPAHGQPGDGVCSRRPDARPTATSAVHTTPPAQDRERVGAVNSHLRSSHE